MSLLKTWVISLVLFLLMAFLPLQASGQQLEHVSDADGDVPGVILIDGKVHFVFSEESARRMLADLEDGRALKLSYDNLEKQNTLLKGSVAELKFATSMLQKNSLADRELLNSALDSNVKWYKQDSFVMISTFVVVSLAYGYWSYTSR